jgi:hypothetical protein
MTTCIVQKPSTGSVNARGKAPLAAAQLPLADCSYRLSTPGAAAQELARRRALQESLSIARVIALAREMGITSPLTVLME